MSNTLFPGAIDSPTNPTTSSTLATVPHHLQHGLENDAIVALETKLGTGATTPTTSSFLTGTGTGISTWVNTLTSPSITTSLLDSNNNTWIGETATASAVNYINVTNNSTGNAPAIGSLGSDTNVDLNITSKGSGKVRDNGSSLLDFRTSFSNFIQSGGVWSATTGLAATMTAAQLWINGVEYTVSAVASHTFGASDDTYVDYTVGTGLTYTAVSNNSASPSLAANSIRLAIVVSGGSAVSSINQGQTNVTAPVASSVVYAVADSLGNLIYPSNPNPGILSCRATASTISSASTSYVLATGLSAGINVPSGKRIQIDLSVYTLYCGATGNLAIYRGTTVGVLTTLIQDFAINASVIYSGTFTAYDSPTSGTYYYSVAYKTSNGSDAIEITSGSGNSGVLIVKAV